MQHGLFQKTIQKRDPEAVSGQKDACWPSPLPCQSSTLKVGMCIFGRLPQNRGSSLQGARSENTLSWALLADSLDWFSCSPPKQPEAGSPSLAICLKHLVIRCKPHTGALKLKCAVTLPPTLAFVTAPGCPSLCQGE